jgi:hypothetical protein
VWLRAVTEDFWRAAGQIEPFPRSLEAPVLSALPLSIVKVARLSVAEVRDQLRRRGIDFRVDAPDRALHGCLVAFRGNGLVLLDGSDPPNELSFSLAHEVGHFLTDYLQPRQRALRQLGPRIKDVIDGRRAPTLDERIDAVLSDVRLGVHMHLMARSPSGAAGCGRIAGSEFRADRLAFELIAPEDEVLRTAARSVAGDTRAVMELALRDVFGLPEEPAREYARFLVGIHGRRPSVRSWLGIEDSNPPTSKVSNFAVDLRNEVQ